MNDVKKSLVGKEQNVIIAINAIKKIMIIFLGPFLATYFIKISKESIKDLSIYYIFSYILLELSSFLVVKIIKNKFKIGTFRIGVILNFIYIMTILIFNSFKTNMNYGLITSIVTILSMISFKLYGKIYTNRDDKKLIIV